MKTFVKNCLNCGKEIETANPRQKFCSDFCGGKYRHEKEKLNQAKALERAKVIKKSWF